MILYPELIFLRRLSFVYGRDYQQRKFLRSIARGSTRKIPEESDDRKTGTSILDDNNGNYLGFQESEDHSLIHGRYVYDSKKAREQIAQKYQPLLRPNKNSGLRRKMGLLNVRIDSENQPRFHGEFENLNKKEFETLDDVIMHLKKHQVELRNEEKELKSSEIVEIDENIERKPGKSPPKSLINEKINFRYADQFSSKDQSKIEENSNDWISYEQSKRENIESKSKEKEMSLSEKIASIKFEPNLEDDRKKSSTKIVTGEEYLKLIREGKRKAHFEKEFDELRKLIKNDQKLDSKGYRILSNQVPNFSGMTNDEILEMLLKQILFNDSDVVALNKPYGIAVHGAFGSTTVSTTRINSKFRSIIHLGFFLPEMAQRLECEKLYPVHRLDRDTTGVLLMAKTQEKANLLNRLFQEQKIEKTYLCITKNRPDHPEGIIDIPIDMGYILSKDGKKRERMVLCPEPENGRQIPRQWRTAKRAVTHYKIKSDWGNAALLEVFPKTGVRHQIRVHLGFGLRCPILGDHKYSQMNDLSPQKLPSDILMALKIRQTKTRHVPMHLHAYRIMIPQAGQDGRNIFILAPLPHHFRKNMNALKLKL